MGHVAFVVCGAPLASRAPDVVRALVDEGWAVSVVATAAASPWIDVSQLRRVTGNPVLTDYRDPGHPKRTPPPTAVIACPITFNSVNKLSVGIADGYPMAVLCEALAAQIPLLAVPMVSTRLWPHPAWEAHLDSLARAGVTFLDVQTGRPGTWPVESGTGDEVTRRFDPAWVATSLGRITLPPRKADVVGTADDGPAASRGVRR